MVRPLKKLNTIIFFAFVASIGATACYSKPTPITSAPTPTETQPQKQIPARAVSSEKTVVTTKRTQIKKVEPTEKQVAKEVEVSAQPQQEPVAPLEIVKPIEAPVAAEPVNVVEPVKMAEVTNEVAPVNTEAVVKPEEPVAVEKPAPPVIVQQVAPVAEPVQVNTEPSGLVKDFWIYGGVGMGFSSISQTVPNISDVNSGAIGTNAMISAGFWADRVGLSLNYRDTPEEINSSNTVTVIGEAKNWKTMSADLLLRAGRDVSAKDEWIFRMGFQQQEMPFLLPVGPNIQTTQTTLTNFGVGIEYKKLLQKNLRVEWLLRVQRPIASSGDMGSDLKVTPKVSFDASVGAVYQLHNNMHLGIFWYNQYQSYGFNCNNNINSTFSGKQTLFLSTFDLRFGLEY